LTFFYNWHKLIVKPSRRATVMVKKRTKTGSISMNIYRTFFMSISCCSSYTTKLISFLSIKPYLFRYNPIGYNHYLVNPLISGKHYKNYTIFSHFQPYKVITLQCNNIIMSLHSFKCFKLKPFLSYLSNLKPSRSIEP
jgi:hypothetical protein